MFDAQVPVEGSEAKAIVRVVGFVAKGKDILAVVIVGKTVQAVPISELTVGPVV